LHKNTFFVEFANALTVYLIFLRLSIKNKKISRKSIFGLLRENLSEPSGRIAALSACDRSRLRRKIDTII